MKRAIAFRRFKVAFARASVIGALVGVCALVLAAGAAAGQPTKTPVNDSVSLDFPAGTVCDFHYSLSGTSTGTQTVFSDRIEFHLVQLVTHVNVDTGYTLTERDQFDFTVYPDGTSKQVGLVFDLRDASGKLVLVRAGQVIFDPSGNVVKITPHMTADFAGTICPALGGSPA